MQYQKNDPKENEDKKNESFCFSSNLMQTSKGDRSEWATVGKKITHSNDSCDNISIGVDRLKTRKITSAERNADYGPTEKREGVNKQAVHMWAILRDYININDVLLKLLVLKCFFLFLSLFSFSVLLPRELIIAVCSFSFVS